jgi:glutaconyl-CoA decarboxylase
VSNKETQQQSKPKVKLKANRTKKSNTNNLGNLLDKFKVKVSDEEFTIELFDNRNSDEIHESYDVMVNGTLYSVEVESLAGELPIASVAETGKGQTSTQSVPLAKPVGGSDIVAKSARSTASNMTGPTQPSQAAPAVPAIPAARSAPTESELDSKTLTAPMPGKILQIKVQVGDEVEAGQPLIILEAMKMENVMTAPASGNVMEIPVQPGVNVTQGEVLVVIE